MLGKNFPKARCPACLYPLPGFAANFFVPEDGLRCRGTRRSLLAGHVRCGAGIAGASAVAERELPPLAGVTGCHAVPFMRRERPCSVARAPVGENGCPPHGAAPGLRRPAQGGCRAGTSVATARTPGAVPLDAGPGQTVLAFGTQMVLVAEVVVALACGIALPLPLGGTGGRPDGGRRLPDRAGRGGHAGNGERERAAFCGHLRGEGGSDAQKAEDGQQTERLALHDGTSWSGQKGKTAILRDGPCLGIRLLKKGRKPPDETT